MVSTKIHAGYRYTPPSGRADPFALAEGLRTHVTPAAALLSHRALVAATVDDIDRAQADSVPLLGAARRFAAEVAEAKRTRTRCSRDFSVSVSVLADPDDPASLLLLVFCEHDISDAMLAVPGVEYFGYWNNTDRPAELTADEWELRAATWDRVLGRAAPVERGLVWEAAEFPLDWTGLMHRDDRDSYIESMIPDRSTRASSLLRRAALEALDTDPTWPTWKVVRAAVAASDAATADEEKVAELAATLPELSAADLVGLR